MIKIDTMQRFEIVPQHYPLWVRENWEGRDGGFSRYRPVIGWTWVEHDGETSLHPVAVVETYTGPYEPPGASERFRDWEITSEGPKD